MVQRERARLEAACTEFARSFTRRSENEIRVVAAIVVKDDCETALLKTLVQELIEENERLRCVIQEQAEAYQE